MEHIQKSYPDRIRIIAEDMKCVDRKFEYDFLANRLRELANELEEKLKQETPKES